MILSGGGCSSTICSSFLSFFAGFGGTAASSGGGAFVFVLPFRGGIQRAEAGRPPNVGQGLLLLLFSNII